MARRSSRRHQAKAAAPKRPPYTHADREKLGADVLNIQRQWVVATPDAHAILKDPRYAITSGSNESDLGNPHILNDKNFYRGLYQINPSDKDRDTFAWPEVLDATSQKLNAMAKANPAILKNVDGKGRTIDAWTPDLIKQHYEGNRFVQTVGMLESTIADIKTMGLKFDGFTPGQQAFIAYSAHVIPQISRLISDNPNAKETVRALAEKYAEDLPNHNTATKEKILKWLDRNPSVFAKGMLTPAETMDKWIASRYTPVVKQFAGIINDTGNSNTQVAQAAPVPVGAQSPTRSFKSQTASADTRESVSRTAPLVIAPAPAAAKPLVAENNSERFSTLEGMHKSPYLQKLMEKGQLYKYVDAMDGDNRYNISSHALRAFQRQLKAAGVHDEKHKPIIVDGKVGSQMNGFAKQLKVETADLQNLINSKLPDDKKIKADAKYGVETAKLSKAKQVLASHSTNK